MAERLNRNNKDAWNAEDMRGEPGSSQTRGGPRSGPWEGRSCQRTSVRRSLCLQGVCGSYCCPITNATTFVDLSQPEPEMVGIPPQTFPHPHPQQNSTARDLSSPFQVQKMEWLFQGQPLGAVRICRSCLDLHGLAQTVRSRPEGTVSSS